MNEVFLGLGGNIGNRMENLELALTALNSCGTVAAGSPVYETEAWGTDSAQPYLNMVVKLATSLDAPALLNRLLHIEKELGRIRAGHQYSDRTIDLDILFFNAAVINGAHLQIPHPRLHLRRFVLVPMHDLAPAFIHPVLKKNITELLSTCNDTSEVKLYKR